MKFLAFAVSLLILCSVQSSLIPFWESLPFLPHLKVVVDEEQARDPKESLQTIFSGFWEYGNISDPVQTINCFDESAANLTLNFIGDMLVQVAREQAIQIPITILKFEQNVPPATLACLNTDPEMDQIRTAYNVAGEPFSEIIKAAQAYILLHLKDLVTTASSGYFYFNQGQYKPLGNLLGQLAQRMVGKASYLPHFSAQIDNPLLAIADNDPISELQDLFDGLFEQTNLSDPTTITACFNETTAQITLDFYGDVINDLANDDYLALVREYHVYFTSIPQNVSQCITSNTEILAAYDAYGFNNETEKTLLQKYLTFGVLHHFILLNDTKTINQQIEIDNYKVAGTITGSLIQNILHPNGELISEQQISDGLSDIMKDAFSKFANQYFP